MNMKTNLFIHCPLEEKTHAYGGGKSYEIAKIEGLWLTLRDIATGEITTSGMHWANMNYSGSVVQQAQAAGAKEMLAWLIKNAIDVSKAESEEGFEELYRMFVKEKWDDRMKTWRM